MLRSVTYSVWRRTNNLQRLTKDHMSIQLPRLLNKSDTSATQAEPQHGTVTTQTNENSKRLSENDDVSPDFVNRNPLNLERMAVARKDRGWSRSHPDKYYWHKIHFEKSNRHITAYVQHYNGSIVVSASTKEWAIKKHLYSTADVAAARNIGRILAQRCLECGISYVKCHIEKETRAFERVDAFITAVTEGGIVLTEPKQITDFTQPIDYFPDNY